MSMYGCVCVIVIRMDMWKRKNIGSLLLEVCREVGMMSINIDILHSSII